MHWDRLFFRHPRSVGETYLEHQQHALSFGVELLFAGMACILHAMVPAIFVTTGSRTVTRLYARMVTDRDSARRTASAEHAATQRDCAANAPEGRSAPDDPVQCAPLQAAAQ